MYRNILLVILTINFSQAYAQYEGLIVNLKDDKTEDFMKALSYLDTRAGTYKILSKDLDIVLVPNTTELLEMIAKSHLVESYGMDAKISTRNRPNDERFASQWGLRLMDMEAAWDVTTGGLFDGKHEIVIAVLDDGFDLAHEELASNIYSNENEVPNNGIDDDNNGYIDDYLGLNIENGSDDHPLDEHGTAVAGIIGAKGNNAIGIAGVMWNVKILPISEVTRQSELIESFQYIVDIRRQWNDSAGEEGAFIAATNYSAGIDMAFGSDPQYKSWCDMYDLLGAVGILNAGATANVSIDVDLEGDMPTTCPSEFLIAVTNIVQEDVLADNAAFGAINIDLGAPGGTEEAPMLALDVNNDYGPFNGTSGATPHVAGTIGLLYSISCQKLTELTYSDPAAAARLVREAILTSTDPNASLSERTTSGGRLNTNKAIEALQSQCSGSQNSEITKITVSQETAMIDYSLVDGAEYYLSIYDAMGRQIHDAPVPNTGTTQQTVELSGLQLAAGIYYFSIYNDKSISSKTVRISK